MSKRKDFKDFIALADRIADMYRCSPEDRTVIRSHAGIVERMGLVLEEGGSEPPGCEHYDLQLVADLLGAFARFRERSRERYAKCYPADPAKASLRPGGIQ